ncbi:MAG TPA: redox-sensing transcriptional repressor Rex, partial [Archaeoglobaceae archaeon]|nr:redox-sensing transcriptional repressor Rex [Archaeoglobaceae archaeon]
MHRRIPEETIIRLSYYLRVLIYLKEEERKELVSSSEIAHILKMSPHQLRKDLSYFGHFGKKGVGYSVSKLIQNLKEILGLNKKWYACVIGFGNLGKALSFYKGFKDQGIFIKVAFDVNPKKIKNYSGLKVYPIEKMEEIIKKEKIKIGIVTVPKDVAKEISNKLLKSGIKAIFNFAPIKLDLPKEIIFKNVDLSCQLAY